MIIIVVGKSGSGKSTFIKAMGLKKYCYEISGLVKKELKEKKQLVNHDNVQPIMHQRYEKDSLWQIPFILNKYDKNKFLIVDGCRSFLEFKKIIETFSQNLVIEIRAKDSFRKERIRLRDNTNCSGFRKIEKDESEITPLDRILESDLIDIVVNNNNSLAALKVKAKKINFLLSFYLKNKGNL
jgi:dephospho-CoA kinase